MRRHKGKELTASWKLSTFYSHLCRARRRRTCSFAAAAGALGFGHGDGERRFALPHASDQLCNLSFRPQATGTFLVRVANRQAHPGPRSSIIFPCAPQKTFLPGRSGPADESKLLPLSGLWIQELAVAPSFRKNLATFPCVLVNHNASVKPSIS